jgi:DNA-directed RNA polymerase I, II, and III subunit RPABC1
MSNARYLNCINTVMEMLSQRKYSDIKKEDEKIIAEKEDGTEIYVFTKIIEKLNVGELNNYISLIQKININHCILLYEGIPTPAVKNVINTIYDIGVLIELFNVDDLQFNITKHILVPLHKKLNKEECKEFKQQYGTSIPVLLKSDPVCRFYNFQKGDIIQITRRNSFVS